MPDILLIGCAAAPLVFKAAQTIAETPHVILWKLTPITGQQTETKELCGQRSWSNVRFPGMQTQPATFQITLDTDAP